MSSRSRPGATGWTTSPASVWALKDAGHAIPALEIAIASDVPMGAGLSSSAALELAVLRAVRAAAGLAVDEARLAVIGRTAENAYVGMPCGIMDQMVAALGSPGQALFLDTRDLSTLAGRLPADHAVAVIHCGVAHRLTAGRLRHAQGGVRARLRRLGRDRPARPLARRPRPHHGPAGAAGSPGAARGDRERPRAGRRQGAGGRRRAGVSAG